MKIMPKLFSIAMAILLVTMLGCMPKQTLNRGTLLDVPTDSARVSGEIIRADQRAEGSNFGVDVFGVGVIGNSAVVGGRAGYNNNTQAASSATNIPQPYVPAPGTVLYPGYGTPGAGYYGAGASYPFVGNTLTIIFRNNLGWNVDVAATQGRQKSPLFRIPAFGSRAVTFPEPGDYTFLITGKGGSDTPKIGVDYTQPTVVYNIGAPRPAVW